MPKSLASVSLRHFCTVTMMMLSMSLVGCKGEEEANQSQAVAVRLKTIELATLIDSTEYIGTLEARERVSLAPRTQGRISRIFASQGDRVSRGQQIFELEPTQDRANVNAATQTVNVERSRLGQSQAELRTAEANRAAAAAEVESARANVTDASSAVELAQIDIDRTQMLVEGGALAQQDLDDARRELEGSTAQLNSQQETLNASIKSLEAAETQIEQANANISVQNAAIERARAELASTSENLAFNTIGAPIDGTIGRFDKKVGDYVNIGEELTTITNNQNFDLNINIPIENRDRLQPGLAVQVVNPDGSPGIEGKIIYIAPSVQQDTQAILTKAVFPNQGSLKDREYLRVRVVWSSQPGILVPTTAISTLGGQDFIYLAKEKQASESEAESENAEDSSSGGEEDVPVGSLIAEQQPIELGSIQAQDYQVISGLKEGDRIAVSNILSLRDGTAISEADRNNNDEGDEQVGSRE